MILQHNMAAMYTNRQLGINTKAKTKSSERLSSGYRINRAADDAAGLAISEKMRAQIRGLEQASDNIQDAISYVQVADGALNEVQSILQRIRELAVQSANDTNTDKDRAAIDKEVQELKLEVDSVFTNTEFNTRPVWDVNTDNKVLAGTVEKPAITMPYTSYKWTVPLDNTNKYLVATGYYDADGNYKKNSYSTTINGQSYSYYNQSGEYVIVASADKTNPDNYGFRIKWTDYYGTEHSSELIEWPKPDNDDETFSGGSFKTTLMEHLNTEDKKIGIDFDITFKITEGATITDIAASLNNRGYYVDLPDDIRAVSNNKDDCNISFSTGDMLYEAFLALDSSNTIQGTDFTSASGDSDFLVPVTDANGNNIISEANMDFTIGSAAGNWVFELENPSNPGYTIKVTSAPSVSYKVSTYDDAYENEWWHWVYWSDGTKDKYYTTRSANEGSTLASIEYAMTNNNKGANGTTLNIIDGDGDTYNSSMTFTFYITSEPAIPWQDEDGNDVGSSGYLGYFNVTVNVGPDDTAQDVMDRLEKLKQLDVNSLVSPSSAKQWISFNGSKDVTINSPLWKASNELNIQAGANTGQVITLNYDALRTYVIGIEDTNVLTRNDADSAISEIDAAMEIVSAQRSYFGAMQNRLEYAKNNADNTSENLQAAESRIRDTDMADEMVRYSKSSILEQTAQALLAQANQSTQGILELLR